MLKCRLTRVVSHVPHAFDIRHQARVRTGVALLKGTDTMSFSEDKTAPTRVNHAKWPSQSRARGQHSGKHCNAKDKLSKRLNVDAMLKVREVSPDDLYITLKLSSCLDYRKLESIFPDNNSVPLLVLPHHSHHSH